MTILDASTAHLPRRTLLLASLLSAFTAAGPALATSGDLVDFAVVDRETGQPLRVWCQGGRAYVAGRPGARYALRVTNNSGGRVLAVMSVDGVNVLSGETAGYDQACYVLGPWQSYDIAGWRKSDTEVAAFTFTALSRSYAARTSRPADVGVLGIAVFRERYAPPPPPPPPVAMASPAPPAADSEIEEVVVDAKRAGSEGGRAVARAQPRERLGTGHGAREWSAVTATTFERATAYPAFTRQIAYDSYENLAALGIVPRPPAPSLPRRPRPFPASDGYVPDPPPGLAP